MAEPLLCPKCGRQCDQQHCPACQAEFDENGTLLVAVEDAGGDAIDGTADADETQQHTPPVVTAAVFFMRQPPPSAPLPLGSAEIIRTEAQT